MQTIGKYCEYFDVDDKYFPCIDDSAIRNGARWENTYPHETFIRLLEEAERMLAGNTRKSLWIHGAYGTGKSQCAYALKKILEVPEDELKAYWDDYSPLKNHTALFSKLIGHKKRGIISAWRYASGNISTVQQLLLAVQESISKSLDESSRPYKGQNTLRKSVLSWLEDETHAAFLDSLLRKPEWRSSFSQSCAEDVINALRNNSDVTDLMDNIFSLADKEGITALSLTSESLREWIIDVIRGNNNLQIVLVWDEFSDFFKIHRNSLGEFQKIASICQEAPFYFVIVTHDGDYSLPGDSSWKVIQERFSKVQITMPDNIAFELTAHAFSVKREMRDDWQMMLNDLATETHDSSRAVVEAVDLLNSETVKNILPIHPMAALVLKNIASAFRSNQRSMFDFIKTAPGDEDEMKAFQYFIRKTGPADDRNLLTVDMLWDFFYVRGSDFLSQDIRLVLDVFGETMQKFPGLSESEQSVLKTILIMQALTQRMSGTLPILAPTDRDIKYAFEGGGRELQNSCIAIAQRFVDRGILIQKIDGAKEYAAAILAGQGSEIEKNRLEIAKTSTTAKLITECKDSLPGSINLDPSLSLRYEIEIACSANFKHNANALRLKDLPSYKFRAVMTLAKDDDEAISIRKYIREIMSDENFRDLVVIDASSTPLGSEAFASYAASQAMAMYYGSNNNTESKLAADRAKQILTHDWCGRISSGEFTVYSSKYPEGEKVQGARNLNTHLRNLVLSRFNYIQDFERGVTQPQLSLSNLKQSALMAINGGRVTGIMSGREKDILGKFWGNENWIDDPENSGEPLTIVAKSLHALIESEFESCGRISVGKIWGKLSGEFGFSVCNLSAFIAGFILRKYSAGDFRSMDTNNHSDNMTAEKLAEMLANFMTPARKTDSFIVKRTQEELAFCKVTAEAWNIPYAELSSESPEMVSEMIHRKIKELKFPLWCLKYEASSDILPVVEKYIALPKADSKLLDYFAEIGRAYLMAPSTGRGLREILTAESCKRGMMKFLAGFEGGILPELAKEIGINDDDMLSDVSRLFSKEYSDTWSEELCYDQIRRLITEYDFTKITNDILNAGAKSRNESLDAWRECAEMSGCSHEDAAKKFPELKEFISTLAKIAGHSDITQNIPGFMQCVKDNFREVKSFAEGGMTLFNEIYASCLEGLSDDDCRKVREGVPNLFTLPSVQAGIAVKQSAGNLRKSRKQSYVYSFWAEHADGTRNPREWSRKYKLPILCCVDPNVSKNAAEIFGMINRGNLSEEEADTAAKFLEALDAEGFFTRIKDKDYRDKIFSEKVIGSTYAGLLGSIDDVKEGLSESMIEPYNWNSDRGVENELKRIARKNYSPEKVKARLGKMSADEIERMLKIFVDDDITLGMKILMWSE